MSPLADDRATLPWVACPQCATRLPCHDPAGSRYFACYKCRTYFRADPTAPDTPGERLDGFKEQIGGDPLLPLGKAGELGGHRCRLTGYQVRSEKDDRKAEWREYQLRPATPGAFEPADFPLQLAEYQGHWLLVRRAPYHPPTGDRKVFHDHTWTRLETDQVFRLWHRYRPVVRYARGEFDWNVLNDEALKIQEFIDPPYQLVSEQPPGQPLTWYLAEYLEPAQVAAAFGVEVAALPDREDVGAAQPAPARGAGPLARLAGVGLLLLVIFQVLVVTVLRPPTQVLRQEFSVASSSAGATSQMLKTTPFVVDGPTALSVDLEMGGLDNHWAEVTASLVNEQTGQGFEFTRSIEYYHGVEGGESWSEGGQDASAVLRQVPAGRYHLNLYPSLEPGAPPLGLVVQAEQHTVLWSNILLALLALAAVPAFVTWRASSFERARWENSNFSPYASSDS